VSSQQTLFGLIVLSPEWALPVLLVVWGGAVVATLTKLF
jgi:hypothetical protein